MTAVSISPKTMLKVALLTLVSAVAIYYSAKPYVFIGYLAALVLIFMAGLFSRPLVGALAGFLGTSAGMALQQWLPQKVSKSYREAHAAYLAFTGHYFWLMIVVGVAVGWAGGWLAERLVQSHVSSQTANTASEKAGQTEAAPASVSQPAEATAASQKERLRKQLKGGLSKGIPTRDLTLMGLFIAMSVAINSVRIGSVSFSGFPIIFIGYVLGPVQGFIVGAVADIISYMVRPSAFAFNPIFTLSSALTGLLPVLVTRLLGEKYPHYSFWKVLVGILFGQVLTSVLLAPAFTVILYGKSDTAFWVQYAVVGGKAAVKQAISIPIYAFLTVSVIESLAKAVHPARLPARESSQVNH